MKSAALALTGAAFIGFVGAGFAQTVRTGTAAYGDWHSDAPGVTRKITPADLAKPLETPAKANRSKVVARPENAALKAPNGFTVEPFATGMEGARVLRIAPNGDIFLSQSEVAQDRGDARGRRRGEAGENRSLSQGLNRPFGIAFYPPGPNPQYAYVGETNQVVRFPYKNGDLVATGKPELIVPTFRLAAAIGRATSCSRPTARPCTFRSAPARTWPRICRRSLIWWPGKRTTGSAQHGVPRRQDARWSWRSIPTARTGGRCPGHSQLLGISGATRHRHALLRHQRTRHAWR